MSRGYFPLCAYSCFQAIVYCFLVLLSTSVNALLFSSPVQFGLPSSGSTAKLGRPVQFGTRLGSLYYKLCPYRPPPSGSPVSLSFPVATKPSVYYILPACTIDPLSKRDQLGSMELDYKDSGYSKYAS